jgi:hypothetical protein
MSTYQHTAFTVPDRYDILYGGHKSDAGVGSGRRRRFLDTDFASSQRCEACAQSPIQWSQVFFSWVLSRPGRGADHSHLVPRSDGFELYPYSPNKSSLRDAQLKQHSNFLIICDVPRTAVFAENLLNALLVLSPNTLSVV